MGEHLLKVSNLIKTFDKVRAVNDVSFFIKSSRGVFDITLGTLPFQNQII